MEQEQPVAPLDIQDHLTGTVEVMIVGHVRRIRPMLEAQRLLGRSADIRIESDQGTHTCHKSLLGHSSDVYGRMFEAMPDMNSMTLTDNPRVSSCFREIVELFYSGRTTTAAGSVRNIMETLIHLDVDDLLENLVLRDETGSEWYLSSEGQMVNVPETPWHTSIFDREEALDMGIAFTFTPRNSIGSSAAERRSTSPRSSGSDTNGGAKKNRRKSRKPRKLYTEADGELAEDLPEGAQGVAQPLAGPSNEASGAIAYEARQMTHSLQRIHISETNDQAIDYSKKGRAQNNGAEASAAAAVQIGNPVWRPATEELRSTQTRRASPVNSHGNISPNSNEETPPQNQPQARNQTQPEPQPEPEPERESGPEPEKPPHLRRYPQLQPQFHNQPQLHPLLQLQPQAPYQPEAQHSQEINVEESAPVPSAQISAAIEELTRRFALFPNTTGAANAQGDAPPANGVGLGMAQIQMLTLMAAMRSNTEALQNQASAQGAAGPAPHAFVFAGLGNGGAGGAAAAGQFVMPDVPSTSTGKNATSKGKKGGKGGKGGKRRGKAKRPLSKVQLVHRNGRSYAKCDECGKELADPSSLYRHRKIHRGEKPHMCKFCNRTFVQRYNMTQHIKTHFKERGPNSVFVKANYHRFVSNARSLNAEERGYAARITSRNVPYNENDANNPFLRWEYNSPEWQQNFGNEKKRRKGPGRRQSAPPPANVQYDLFAALNAAQPPADGEPQPGPSHYVPPVNGEPQPGPSHQAPPVNGEPQPGPSHQAPPANGEPQPGPSRYVPPANGAQPPPQDNDDDDVQMVIDEREEHGEEEGQ